MTQPHHGSWQLAERIAAAVTEALRHYAPDLRCKIQIEQFDKLPILPEDIQVTFRAPQRRDRKGLKT